MREDAIEDMPPAFPTVGRLVLAAVMREEMDRCGFTTRTLAVATGMSSATVNRCMMGKREVTEYELGAFGTAFKWTRGARNRARRLRTAGGTGSGSVHHRGEILAHLHRMTLESVTVAPWVLPARLRTSGYDTALTGHARKAEHWRPWSTGQHSVVYLTRQAVTMPSGMATHQRVEQFAYLSGLAEREEVDLRFLSGQIIGVQGLEPFELVRLNNDTRFVRLNHHGITTLLDNPADVDTYQKVIGDLDSVAQPSYQWRSWLRQS